MKAKDLKGKLINSEVHVLKQEAHIRCINSTLIWRWTELNTQTFLSKEVNAVHVHGNIYRAVHDQSMCDTNKQFH
jgi:hypothetical protein